MNWDVLFDYFLLGIRYYVFVCLVSVAIVLYLISRSPNNPKDDYHGN